MKNSLEVEYGCCDSKRNGIYNMPVLVKYALTYKYSDILKINTRVHLEKDKSAVELLSTHELNDNLTFKYHEKVGLPGNPSKYAFGFELDASL